VPIGAELRQIFEELRATSLRVDGHVVAQDLLRHIGTPLEDLCRSAGVEPWTSHATSAAHTAGTREQTTQ
jgi:hypothetical protein